ncbi:MAG: hypothetical protein II599_00095 [Bacteroidales bacterium]|nr:hypothetical protein [Bacteroidales bacterium]MBQ4168219.1 hypothetical protein [Bacteroidales bacterium]
MSRTASRIALFSALILSVLSCSEPLSTEKFIQNTDGRYSFEVDMTHTDCAYDLFFYSRVDSWKKVPEFPIDVMWTSPSGARYSERVYFVRDGHDKVAYRTGLIPEENGVWKLDATADAEGLRGLGLVCRRVY